MSTNKLGVGFEFHIGMSGDKKLDEFFTDIKAMGVTVINEPKTEFWGERIFTVSDSDGYHLTFTEHVNDVSPEAWTMTFESAHQE